MIVAKLAAFLVVSSVIGFVLERAWR